jgi:hypothetical protein
MGKWEIAKRTFEAKKFPKGSEARKRLNRNAITSEYGSDKFIVFKGGRRHDSYKSLTSAKTAVRIGKMYG